MISIKLSSSYPAIAGYFLSVLYLILVIARHHSDGVIFQSDRYRGQRMTQNE